ncbi:hypothetical protein GGU10DRAFT_338476 [Lentinula aff. detonsa]|uniref:Uncharacterized protein n=1 Tax=Lentinula aff. detonsa TaxID=2804958 RepID=A0AA38NTT2_9AGAR|nr:hypothetical protein GGU10DRAFT_338476 [Lentinula aff. detonsa]
MFETMSSIKTESIHEFHYPRSASPTKESLRPNAHPYAIKTTSTALLSRSNSSSRTHDSSHHHYVPQTPPATSPGPRKHGSGHYRHRYSSSLSSDNLPRPLPVPPSPTKEALNDYPRKYSRPFSNAATVSSAPLTLEDLPPNPKLWTPSQLCAYLATALRVKSGESLQIPVQVARDIAGFVRESHITGKAFLRLNEKDLEAYGVNKLWKNALLRASQTLRQNVLKGHIWGFVDDLEGVTNGINFPSTDNARSGSVDEDEDEDSTPHRRRRSASQPQTTRLRFIGGDNIIQSFPNHSFPNGLPEYSSASSSSSSDDLFSPAGISPLAASYGHSRYSNRNRNGRVKGMVDTFERSSSFDEGDPTSAKLLQEIKGRRELDLETLRKIRRERSGSTSSISSGSFGSSHSPTSSDDGSETGAPAVVASPVEEYNVSTITSSRPLPTPPPSGADIVLSPSSHVSEHEEPSIEELLAQEGELEDSISGYSGLATLNSTFKKQHPSFAQGTFSISKGKGKAKKRGGVYAWEDEVEDLGAAAPGKTTAKRVTSQVPIPATIMSSVSTAKDVFGDSETAHGIIREESAELARPVEILSPALNSGRGSGTHTPSRPLPEIPLHPSLVSLPEPEDIIFSPILNGGMQVDTKESDEEAMLRASISETTELLRAFNARLGEVERKVDTLEVELKDLEVANAIKDRQRNEERENLQSKDAEQKAHRQDKVEETSGADAFLAEWPIMRKVFNRVFRSAPSGQPPSIRSRIFDPQYWRSPPNINPQTFSQLPPYVLLVGLGVCAVVLRIFAKKLIGKR